MKNKLLSTIMLLVVLSTTIFSTTIMAEEAVDNYGDIAVDYEPAYPTVDSYPVSSITKYDPRLKNGVTPIKEQIGGTCCFFTTNAVMEMATYVNTGLKYSYSEEAMTWIQSNKLAQYNGLPSGTSGYYNRHANRGSTVYCTSSYITNRNNPIITNNNVNWLAPNYSTDVPFTGSTYINTIGRFPTNIDTSFTNAYASGTLIFPEAEMKNMILDYGAVYVSVNADSDNCNGSTGAIYSNDNTGNTNHGITVIGWDDNYSYTNFRADNMPNSNGAWLIKNSWGSIWGEDGYGWVSYEDTSFASRNACFVVSDVEKVSKNEYTLSYDFMPLIKSDDINLGSNDNGVYIANIYDVSELNETYSLINKVMFYSRAIDTLYRVYITPLDDNGNIPPISQIGNSRATGFIDYEGYRTAELTTPFEIDENVDKYAIIIGFITDDNSVTLSSESENYNPSINSGESYAYYSGTWHDKTDMDSAGNYCIRPTLVRRTSITQNSQLSVNYTHYQDNEITIDIALNGNQLYCIWNGNEILYEDVDFARNGNAITFKKDFLDSLSTTTYTNIIFEFTDGTDQVLKIYPKAISEVILNGKAAQGQTLTAIVTCTDSTLPSANQVTYQWQSSSNGNTWSNINGANSALYTLTANERLKYIRCSVSVNNNSNLICPGTTYSNPTSTKVVLYGDVDLDGSITISDATAIQRYLAKLIDLNAEQLVAANVDGDNKVSILDSYTISRYLSKLIDYFPVEA